MPKIKDSHIKKTTAKDLIDLIPEELINTIVENLQTDKWVKKFNSNVFLKLILFSILNSERNSLRIMEENYKDPFFQALAPSIDADNVVHTGIRNRLMNMNSDFFKHIYENLYSKIDSNYNKKQLDRYNIRRYDSTMIATFSHLLEGMRVGNSSLGKRQVKLTTEFTNDFLISANFYNDQSHLSEETALKETIKAFSQNCTKTVNKKNSIHVFDKGLKSRKTFSEFDSDSIQFVTRLNQTPRYELVSPNLCSNKGNDFYDTDELEFIQDSNVKLYLSGHNSLTNNEYRLIQFRIKDKSKESEILSFLTNVKDITALEIAQIYRKRWDIEVLFRFMKQEMNLTHFVCNDKNAIKIMLYCTMIASMLVLLYKKLNDIKSYKKAKVKFFKELLSSIMLDIIESPELLIKYKDKLKFLARME